MCLLIWHWGHSRAAVLCQAAAQLPKFNLHSPAVTCPRRSEKERRGWWEREACDSTVLLSQRVERNQWKKNRREASRKRKKHSIIQREWQIECETKPTLCLQEVQNYSSSQGRKKKERAKVEEGRADGVSVGKEGGIARRETEQKDKPGRWAQTGMSQTQHFESKWEEVCTLALLQMTISDELTERKALQTSLCCLLSPRRPTTKSQKQISITKWHFLCLNKALTTHKIHLC